MTLRENIQQVVEAGPDFMGFIFFSSSKRYVGDKLNNEITALISPGIKKVGVFVNEDVNHLLDIMRNNQLDMVQLHGGESPKYCKMVSKHFPVIKVFSVDEDFNFEETNPFSDVADYFLFDTKTSLMGGSGRKFNWKILSYYAGKTPFFLSGGIDLPDIEEIIKLDFPGLYAVDINSRFEESPGIKNPGKVKTFINIMKKI